MTHPLDEERSRPVHAEAWWLVRVVLMWAAIGQGVYWTITGHPIGTLLVMLIALALKPNMEEE